MSRKETIVECPSFPGTDDRDRGKLFHIKEWPASKAENWALRILFAANKGGGELPTSIAGIGMEGIAILGLNTFLRGNIDAGELIPIMDELLDCVSMVRDPSRRDIVTKLSESDIEEVPTRLWLRGEVLTLHTNFPVAAALRRLYSKIMTTNPSPTDSSSPSTSLDE